MKKLSAILLSGLLFFNWYGYRFLFAYWQQRNDRRIETRLDSNDYDESALISVKVPAADLAYYNNSTGFERVDGMIKVGNVTYRYVKRRIFADSIELLCIPDTRSTCMQQALDQLASPLNNPLQFPKDKTLPGRAIQKVYTQATFRLLLGPGDTGRIVTAWIPVPMLSSGHDRPSERPPATCIVFC